MELNFEFYKEVGPGASPDLVHFPNTQGQVFYTQSGQLYGIPTEKIEHGLWGDVELQEGINISPDKGISFFAVDALPGWGAVGGYKTGNLHKMIIYEFAWEMDKYLESGSISHRLENPISSFSLKLQNQENQNPQYAGNTAINEKSSLLSPGAKVSFGFSMGNSSIFEMGNFYVDRSNFSLGAETSSVSGRNLVGKALKDQTLDENHEFTLNNVNLVIEEMLKNANLEIFEYVVDSTNVRNSFKFKPNMSPLDALQEIFKGTSLDWEIRERMDGVIEVGENRRGYTYYRFKRNKDIFSRKVTRDDLDSYNRVCVHDRDFEIAIYRDVKVFTSWNLHANKTLYIQVPEGTRYAEANAFSKEAAKRLENVGKVEDFTGPFRPQIEPGDVAIIVEDSGEEELGLITELTHAFGKDGFYTNFTVDSGGVSGKGRLSDFISRITKDPTSSMVGYED